MGGLLGRWLLKMLMRKRPPEGWGSIVLTLAAVGALAGSVTKAAWLRHAPSWLVPVWLATLLAMWWGRHLRQTWLAGLILTLTGVVMAYLRVAQAWPSLTMLVANGRYLWLLWTQPELTPPPVIALGPWWLERVQWLATDVMNWAVALSGDTPASSARVLALLFYLALWFAGAWAGWVVVREHRVLKALLPTGILLAVNVFFAATGQEWLLLMMMALALLSVRMQQFHREQDWMRHDVDFSPEYRLDLYVVSVFATAGILAMMMLAPNVRVQPTVNAFWSFFDAPYLQIERESERLLTGIDQPPRRLIGGGDVAQGGLPRVHLLGGDPALGEQVVLRVRIDTPFPPHLTPNLRWRALTFSIYNGRGWENPPPIAVQRYGAGEIWDEALAAQRLLVQQSFDFGQGQPYWLYALAEPVVVDRPYRVHLRADADPVGLDIRAGRYTVISALADASEAALRAAPPADAQALAPYLQLPPGIPPRVYQLARELSAGLDNAYDQARAIETYLRGYRYNLQVPSPPVQRDVVDWFLFDLRQGYCDYYATSMVVMARSLGIPARLAIGYAPGTLDPETGWMTVTEADAHSWPELYFEDLGWIPFEPTAARAVYVWPASIPAPADEAMQNAAALERLRRRAWWRHGLWRWPAALLAALGLFLAIRAARREWQLRRRARHAWQLGYWRLAAWGRRWGVATADWHTPAETRQLWWLTLHHAPLPDRLVQETMATIDALVAGMMQRAYAPARVWPPDVQARQIWRRLHWHLWNIRLRRGWQRLWRRRRDLPGADSSP